MMVRKSVGVYGNVRLEVRMNVWIDVVVKVGLKRFIYKTGRRFPSS